jgi:hypothetical protein
MSVTPEDDSAISEISILPDGRVCLFGASQQVLEMLYAIPLGDPALESRLDRLGAPGVRPAVQPNEACSTQSDDTGKNQVRS